MSPQFGKLLVLLGLGLAVVGGILWLGGSSWFGWFGRLPGDIRIERPGFRLYAPLVSMLLVSIACSLLMWLIRRLG